MDAPLAEPLPECPRCRVEIPRLEARLLELETKLRDLEDRLKPPPPKRPHEPQPPAPAKVHTGKKRGAQPGHPPHLKSFLPSERVKAVIDHAPERCASCDRSLSAIPNGDDPKRHQIAELPAVLAEITEHRGHSRTCPCGHTTRAPIPADIRKRSLGPHLTAAAVYLIGSFGLSKRNAEEVLEGLFGVPVALGTISNLEREAMAALEPAYREARKAVADAPVKNVDETGWKQGGLKRWLWAAATDAATVFPIHPRRNLDALTHLLGKLSGILVSDRWVVYDDWPEERRQLCWAHVKRNWEKRIEFGGEAEELGERWLAGQKAVFELWHRFKAGTLDRNGLQERMTASIDALGDLLAEGIDSRDAGLSAYCQRLHDRFPMYWLFTSAEGVEPTNNHAERVQRRAVLWRRKSFGCASQAGCRFAERILTVVGTLRLQGRNALEFLSRSIAAHRAGSAGPMLCMG
jgi:transposase